MGKLTGFFEGYYDLVIEVYYIIVGLASLSNHKKAPVSGSRTNRGL